MAQRKGHNSNQRKPRAAASRSGNVRRKRSAKRESLGRRLAVILAVAVAFGIYCLVAMMHSAPEPVADSNAADIAAAEARGHELAERALATPPMSMAREEALLYMRSIETQLREAGYSTAAEAFAKAADEILTGRP